MRKGEFHGRSVPMRLAAFLEELGSDAIRRALGVDAPAVVRATQDDKHGDFQLNGAMPLAKKLGRKPRDLGEEIARALATSDAIQSAEVAGPGFVNVRLKPTWLGARLAEELADRARDGVPAVAKPERIVVDFSSPNIAKQMHVGHLRSTIIGASIVKLLRFVGHDVITDNHIGDWGTQFGLLIVGMRRFGDEAALEQDAIVELERVYKLATAEAKTDPAFADAARAELAKLQAGDRENRALWERFVATSLTSIGRIYERLGVTFDHTLGESAYDSMLAGVVDALVQKNLAREDQGAICVFFEAEPDVPDSVFIVRKKDGAFLYSTTDIATVLYRREHFQNDRALYVHDGRQSLHFKQVFAVARKLDVTMRLEHVGFGTVLGSDGKPLKAREGKAVTLASLLDEAEERAAARIREEGLEVPDAEIASVARKVGIGAVKYADLRQNRLSDYQFDWDKMISFKGNAGPYLQYACARVGAIFRKGGIDASSLTAHATLAVTEPAELALGRTLLAFGDVVHEAAETREPHLICDHLYALARAFSAFYEACPVLKADDAGARDARLALCALTGRQLARGLELLGIDVVERM